MQGERARSWGLEAWPPLQELNLSPFTFPVVRAATDPGALTCAHPLHLITSLSTLSALCHLTRLPATPPGDQPWDFYSHLQRGDSDLMKATELSGSNWPSSNRRCLYGSTV